jgi:alkanesulfonate monooxygenase SsuD/methylene tetrahydromethanopterin reductase-like flavin-dependent oxidoreductase (luciferase family)
MHIGIGLPSTIPNTPGSLVVQWAQQAEARGFSSLGTIDRIAFPSYESLIALAAAAGATSRIGLMSDVLLGPTRDPVVLAKEAASLDQASSGRFLFGVGVGGRQDDYDVVGRPFHSRGRDWDQALDLMHRAWSGQLLPGSPEPVAPRPTNGTSVPVIIGGNSDQAIQRVLRWGVGWTAGGSPPEGVQQMAARVREAWRAAGKPGQPRIVALVYYALGPNADAGAAAYLGHYYGFTPWGKDMWRNIPRTPEAVAETVKAFEAAGADELICFPTIGALDQLQGLADAVLR